jgi:GTPase Era involved in 16S rRNA processing
VREKVLETTGEELPYVTAVVTEKWEDERADFTRIHCAIFVERGSQKKIIIGHGASTSKKLASRAARHRKIAWAPLSPRTVRKGRGRLARPRTSPR